jgi:hypothetical protein
MLRRWDWKCFRKGRNENGEFGIELSSLSQRFEGKFLNSTGLIALSDIPIIFEAVTMKKVEIGKT